MDILRGGGGEELVNIRLYRGPHEDLGEPVVGTENTQGSKNMPRDVRGF